VTGVVTLNNQATASGTVTLTAGAPQNLVVNLGPITQRLAGTVRFVLPTGTQSSVNGITTTTSNDLFTGLLGTLGAAATVTDSAGSTNFATSVGGNITGVTATSRDDISLWGNGENVTDTTGYTGTTRNVVAPLTLRFNAAGSSIVTIPDGGLLKLISGGILQTGSAGTTITTLAAGVTTLGLTTVDVTSTAGMVVGATVTGTGIAAGTTVASIVSGTQFTLSSAATASGTGIADLKVGTMTSISGGTLRALTKELIINTDTAAQRLTITSLIDGNQALTKTGEGTLVLKAIRQANDFSGAVQIQAGGIELSRTGRGSFAIGDSAPIYFSNQDSSSLSLLSDGPVLQSISLTGANLTNTSPIVTVASTAGLVAGVVVTGTGIPAGATVLSVDSATQFTLAVPATSTTSGQTVVVAATAIGSKVITLASTSGLAPGMTISAPGVYPGAVIVSIDSANRITMDRGSYTDAIAATNFQFGTTYSETVGSIAGGNRQTNANWAYINLGVGTTLNINETTASTFVGEFAGLGAVRLAGNATLTLTNTHNSFGNLIIDRGAL